MEIIRLYSPTFYDVSRAAQQWKLKNCKQSVISFWLQVLCSGITEGGGSRWGSFPRMQQTWGCKTASLNQKYFMTNDHKSEFDIQFSEWDKVTVLQ